MKPIIVKLYETPHDPTGLSDVFIGALGLTGFIVVCAVVAGIVIAGGLFLYRRRSA